MLVSLLITVIVLGLIYWLLQMVPLPEPFKTIALVLFIIIAIVYLLGGATGRIPSF